MLDSDVDMLYQYEMKNIDKAVKRNIERFSEDFCFQYNFFDIAYNNTIYYNIFKDCGGSLRTTPRSSRYNIIYYSFFWLKNKDSGKVKKT